MVPSSELTGCDGWLIARGSHVSDINAMWGFPKADRTWPYHDRASAAPPVTPLPTSGLHVGLSLLRLISLGGKSAGQ
jgi:hypothetical protein